MATTLAPALEQRQLYLVEAEGDWLDRNREAIDAALEESFATKERGESYSPEESLALLAQNRAARTSKAS